MRIFVCIIIFTFLTIPSSCNTKQEEIELEGESDKYAVAADIADQSSSDKIVTFEQQANTKNEQVAESKESNTQKVVTKLTASKKKIIKDGSISIKTNDINASKKEIDNLIKKLNAYYESEDLLNNDYSISYNLKIRVPTDKFEILISSIENGKDELKSKSIKARDVTEEYYDIETRLTNKREYLKRYKELLSKALTVKDILAVEENIRTLQEEIESKEGRLKYLSDQISFSTLDINLYKEKEFVYNPQHQDKFWERLKTAVNSGFTSVVDFILWTITILPFIVLALICFILIKRMRKNRKNRQT